jgi:transposase
LDGFTVIGDATVDGAGGRPLRREIKVRAADDAVGICCLGQKLVSNGPKWVKYRDLKMGTLPTWLLVRRQRFSCKTCKAVLYSNVPHVEDDHRITSRLREAIVLSSIKRTFADVVDVHGVEEALARRVFRKYADERLLPYRYPAPRVLGIDENHLLKDLRGVIVDVENGKLLDILEGRTQSNFRRGFQRMEDWDNVEVWCQDMAGAYKGLAQDLFPKATIVVDKFHVLTKANHWFMKVRLSESPKLPAEVRKNLPGLIRVFDMREDSLTARQKDRVAEVMAHSRRLSDAYAIKESFYYWYDAPTRADAEAAYTQWVQFVRSKDQMLEWKPLLTMMQRWRDEIFNYFDHRYTSGAVERMNRSIADINRMANGMDFQTLRAKAILRYSHLVDQDRFVNHLMTAEGCDVSSWMAKYLEPDAFDEDDDPERVLVGSGFDPSTLAADLEAGLF